MNKRLNNILSRWVKPSCLLCQATISSGSGSSNSGMCQPCVDELPYLASVCPQCSIPLFQHQTPQTRATGNQKQASHLCGQCQTTRPYFDHSVCVFHYETPVDKLIQHLKFHQKLANANILGQLLLPRITEHISISGFQPECIIPVPLHVKRMRQRGFNQALELARPISKILGIPIDSKYCHRIKNTTAQTDLPAKERAKYIRQAFTVTEPYPFKKVAIIDDVITTGQTANTLAHKLKQSGVEEIAVWAIARATLK